MASGAGVSGGGPHESDVLRMRILRILRNLRRTHITQISQISQISRSQIPPMTAATADLFTPIASELPDDVARGFQMLASSPPLWPVPLAQWLSVVDCVTAFAARWDRPARARGWSTFSLYRLHPGAPLARLDAMGAAWLLARSGHRAIAVAADAIEATTARLRIYKTQIDPAAVVGWSPCQRGGAP
jgi:hypothetical protein